MRTLLLLSAFTIALSAGEDASAEYVPRWLHLSGELRTRMEGRTAFGYEPGNDDAYGLVRLRLNLELRPVAWFSVYFQGQDSRAPGLDAGRPQTTVRNPFDVRQAYVRLGRDNGPLRVTAGRQLLSYGAQRLIGPLDWTNNSRAWDAVKLEAGTANVKVDLFAASVVVPEPAHRVDRHRQGFNIHGAYGSLKKVIPAAVIEPYIFWKTGAASIWTTGLRIASAPGAPGLHGFDYQAEFARQLGRTGAVDHRALAGYAIAGYAKAGWKWSPHFAAEYSHASGDPHPDQGPHRTFDQLLPTNHLFYGVTDPTGWQNMRMLRLGADARPCKRLVLNADYRWLWLDQAEDALYDAAGRVAVRPRAGNSARAIGTELDFTATWNASAQWRAGAGIGHLFAGEFLRRNSHGSPSTFPYLFAQYSF